MTKKGWVSAADLMAGLQNDPEFLRQQAERDRLHQENAARVRAESEPVLRELQSAGFSVNGLEELALARAPIPGPAINILLSWLPRVKDERVQEMIVRALAATTEPFDGVPLARAFDTTRSESLRWAIGNTLALTNATGVGDWLLQAITDPSSGTARETLAIAVARLTPTEAANRALTPLLEDLPGSVAQALCVSGGPDEVALLEAQLERTKGWQKKELKRAIRAIQKRHGMAG